MLEVSHVKHSKHIGSEISLGIDRVVADTDWYRSWPFNWLPFSNGRAAVAWLLDNAKYQSISVCAYTCPKFVAFLRRRDLDVRLYDVGEEPPRADWAIIPALFGSPPWCEYRGRTIIDAAQTAFGHMDIPLPKLGAVLSCPRKCTELADGAVLAMSHPDSYVGQYRGIGVELLNLPTAAEAVAYKTAARAMWSLGDVVQAVQYNDWAEAKWPEMPHRMSDASFAMLQRLDREWHCNKRYENLSAVRANFYGKLPYWVYGPNIVPFSCPVFVANPAEVVAAARAERIYLTRLWPNATHDPVQHPAAHWMVMHMVSLPVDQRHDVEDMARVAELVLSVAKRPDVRPPHRLWRFLG